MERKSSGKFLQLRRHLIQALSAVGFNSYIPGFASGRIYQGSGKYVCVPGLNCYSCPGALGSCPIGALQAVLGGRVKSFPFYVVGFLLLFGALLGRLVCGFLCPFGLIQDLLHKIPVPKLSVPERIDKPLRKLKYLILVGLVIIAPIFLTDPYGVGAPAFCKYLCPAGMLEGGIPLLISNPTLRSTIGFLFDWKIMVLIVIVILSMFIYRPFCKYLCPLGAIYGFFNKFSFYSMRVDRKSCTHCGSCSLACKMGVDVTGNINSAECIRCGACKSACPTGAVRSGFGCAASPTPREKPARTENP